MIKNLSLFQLYLILLAFSSITKATTVSQISSESLVNNSELIIQGNISSVNTQMNSRGMIYTFVTFEVEEVIFGDHVTSSPLVLRFTGGTFGTKTLDVGATIPNTGDRGIYFIERVNFGLVNPILGWDQGLFTINEEGLVIASDNSPVLSIRRVPTPSDIRVSNGIANGIDTHANSIGSEILNPPMSLIEFKNQIRKLKK